MKVFFIVTSIALAGFFCRKAASEQKSKRPATDVFTFGVEGGLKAENYTCYKIQKEKIYQNNPYKTIQQTILFNNDPLANDKYLLAKELKDNFPAYLRSHPNQTFGCPNCADQGAVHIEMEHNGVLKSWDIDTNKSLQPVEIRPYIERLLQIISKL